MKKRKLTAVFAIILAVSLLTITAFANTPPPKSIEVAREMINRNATPPIIKSAKNPDHTAASPAY